MKKWDGSGFHVQIETGSTCNAACHFCPYHSEGRFRKTKFMDAALFHKIIDELGTIPETEEICLMGLNEPLLDERIYGFVEYATKTVPQAKTLLYTNGFLLTPARYSRLQDAGIDMVIVSLNAVRPDQHAQVMGVPEKFDTVVANIKAALALEKTAKVRVHATCDWTFFTHQDALDFRTLWGMERTAAVLPTNWAGKVDPPPSADSRAPTSEACVRALNFMYVTCEGKVTTCCLDPFGEQVFGDLNTQSIREVFNSEKYYQFREDHANNKADKYAICRSCTRI